MDFVFEQKDFGGFGKREEFHRGLVNLTVDLSVHQIPIIWHRACTLKVLIIMG